MTFGPVFARPFSGVFDRRGAARQTLVLQPDAASGKDTWIFSNAANFNSGISVQLVAGNEAPNSIYRGLLQFDLSALPSGASVVSATLELYCESEAVTTDYVVSAHRALTQWFEGNKNAATLDAGVNGSTWAYRNNNGAVAWAGGAGGASGSDWTAVATAGTTITGVGAFTWDVKADVQNWANGTASNYGWWLINASETGSTNSRKRFTSSDGATATNRPKLTIVYE